MVDPLGGPGEPLEGEVLLNMLAELPLEEGLFGDLDFYTLRFLPTVDFTFRYLLGDDLISLSC